jgi:hypothetical protein
VASDSVLCESVIRLIKVISEVEPTQVFHADERYSSAAKTLLVLGGGIAALNIAQLTQSDCLTDLFHLSTSLGMYRNHQESPKVDSQNFTRCS